VAAYFSLLVGSRHHRELRLVQHDVVRCSEKYPVKHIPSLQLSLRAAIAAVLALAAAQLLQLQHPLYAFISAVIVTDLEPSQTRKLALPRLAGTAVGSAIGATINMLLPSSLWTIGSGVFVAMFVSHVISLPAAARVAGYVSGIILLDHGDSPWSYAFFRMIETALGIGAAIAIGWVPRLMPGAKPNQEGG
jgi:uncharacterized membrane protein YgaE (UPF0421/DUF939 family)